MRSRGGFSSACCGTELTGIVVDPEMPYTERTTGYSEVGSQEVRHDRKGSRQVVVGDYDVPLFDKHRLWTETPLISPNSPLDRQTMRYLLKEQKSFLERMPSRSPKLRHPDAAARLSQTHDDLLPSREYTPRVKQPAVARCGNV
jgi:hypothetical protein